MDAASRVGPHVLLLEQCRAGTRSPPTPLRCSAEGLHGAVHVHVHVVTTIGDDTVIGPKLEKALTFSKIERNSRLYTATFKGECVKAKGEVYTLWC